MSFKTDFLDEAGEVKINKKEKINFDSLVEPLEWEDAVCKIVCNQCKTVQEINLFFAKILVKIIKTMEVSLPKEFKTKEDFQGWYFILPHCNNCKSNKNIEELRIQKLPRLN